MTILDDASRAVKPSDDAFINNLNKAMASNKRYTADRFGKPEFTLEHYAGKVIVN